MYYKRPPRKRFHHYLFPFFVIALIFTVVILGWRSLTEAFVDDSRNTHNEKVFLNIEAGSAKAMTVGKSEWQNAPDKIYLYRGERVKTSSDGRATLTFFEDSAMRLNTNTEVSFKSLQKKNDEHTIDVVLEDGDVWANVERIRSNDSSFSISTDLLQVETRGAVLAITNPGTVYMIQGNAEVGVKYDDDVIKTFQVGVGQQLVVDAETIEKIERSDDVDVIFALSDQFKRTNWYRWNLRKDDESNASLDFDERFDSEPIDLDEELDEPLDIDEELPAAEVTVENGDLVFVTKPSTGLETNKKNVTVAGKLDEEEISAIFVNGIKATVSGTNWTASAVGLPFEGANDIEIEAEDVDGNKFAVDTLVVTYDKTPPLPPVVTEPKLEGDLESGEVVEIDDVEQTIGGTVTKDTAAVIVDDYRLGKYVPGSESFEYYAKIAFDNLKVGDNEYKIYAEDKAGNQSEPTVITLHLPQEVVDEAGVKTDDEPEDLLPEASSSGGVKITAPNGGESLETSETSFEIKGTVPSNTDYVEVNDYRLTKYNPGDATFLYFADSGRGSLEIGEKNTYTVKAYDAEDGLIGEASITIDVESGSDGAPEITIPSADANYSTTLNEIVLGGNVGKWITRMYVNNKEIKEYIPGSEEWRFQVSLTPGANTFTVVAEKQGEEVGSDVIVINFTP